jgi:hypothetical protein
MKKLIYLSLAFLFVSLSSVLAQDKIYKKGGEVIEAKIIEIGVDEIKYRLYNVADGPAYTIEKDRIIKVVYENGRVETYQSSFKDAELYADQKKMALKVNFLSPLLGFTAFSFEKSMKPGRSYEYTLGIIGLGKRQKADLFAFDDNNPVYRQQGGAYVSAGYKFIKLPDFTSRGSKFSHVMQGTYIKPEAMLGVFSSNRYFSTYNSRTGSRSGYQKKTTVFGGALVNLGKQWVFSDVFLVDVYGGVGYNINNDKNTVTNTGTETVTYEFNGYHYGMVSTGDGSGLGFTSGFRIGILLGKKPVAIEER